ncbi:MAG: hypothetical protein A2Z34_02620 [Planctomycetes bacterium RBG_16_59_8]|nr:MAG: hypothetical protein A2Z34_02620 [Planctomycetes bacterium RBG_16_59_8]
MNRIAASLAWGAMFLLSCGHQERPAAAKSPTPATDVRQAAERGVAFLAASQQADGSFPTGIDRSFKRDYFRLGVNTFSALALMSADGDYADHVRKSVRFALENMSDDGYVVYRDSNRRAPYFEHAMGLLLLGEYLLRYPQGEEDLRRRVREKLEKGVQWTIAAQRENGGWPYRDKGQIVEAIGTALQLEALRSARDAGIRIPDQIFRNGIALIKGQAEESGGFRCKTTDPAGRTAYEGSTYPIALLEAVGESQSPEAVRGIVYLRETKNVEEQLKWFPEDPENPVWLKGGLQLTCLWTTMLAFRRAPKEEWQGEWFRKVHRKLVESQSADGSWPGLYGPVYGTSIGMLLLNIEKEDFHWFNVSGDDRSAPR